MTLEEKADFANVLRAVYALYRVECSEAVMQIWWEALKDVEFSAIKGALTRHATNPDSGQFCPKPADVVRELGGTRADQSLMAWNAVVEAIKAFGGWQTVDLGDGITHRVLEEMGGWVWLCENLVTDNFPFLEKRFRDGYRAHLARGFMPEHPSKLLGRFDIENAKEGYASPSIQRIKVDERKLLK